MAITILPKMTIERKAVKIVKILEESGLSYDSKMKVLENVKQRLENNKNL